MKKIITIILILLSFSIYSQDTLKRYPPRYNLNGMMNLSFNKSTLEDVEFILKGDNKEKKEFTRITFQDIESNSRREILFQETISFGDIYAITIPERLIGQTGTIILSVIKGDTSFFVRINVSD